MKVLDDFLNQADPRAALGALTGDLGRRLRLPARADEVGVVVPSVLSASRHLESRYPGMTRFFLGEGSPSRFVEHGKNIPFTTRVGFGYYKGLIIELAEPGIGSDLFAQSLDPAGRIEINHVGFRARGPTLRRKEAGATIDYAPSFAKAGYTPRVDADLNVLGFIGHITIFDTAKAMGGLMVEFLDFRLFSDQGAQVGFPYRMLSAAAWIQENIGPRFLKLPAKARLPPEKT